MIQSESRTYRTEEYGKRVSVTRTVCCGCARRVVSLLEILDGLLSELVWETVRTISLVDMDHVSASVCGASCRHAHLDRCLRRRREVLVPSWCVPDGRRGLVLDLAEVALLLLLENLATPRQMSASVLLLDP